MILFASSCHWSNRCFFDLPQYDNREDAASTIAAWFTPRLYTTTSFLGRLAPATSTAAEEMSVFLAHIAQTTVAGLANALKESATEMIHGVKGRIVLSTASSATATAATTAYTPSSVLADTGIGAQLLRNLLGRSEWTLPCVGVKLVL